MTRRRVCERARRSYVRGQTPSMSKLNPPLQRAVFLSAICIVGLAACTWRSPGLPAGGKGGMAVLEYEDPERCYCVVTRIDRKRTGTGLFDRFELSPGPHLITMAPNAAYGSGSPLTRQFHAKAGVRYVLAVTVDSPASRNGIWAGDWDFSIVEAGANAGPGSR